MLGNYGLIDPCGFIIPISPFGNLDESNQLEYAHISNIIKNNKESKYKSKNKYKALENCWLCEKWI
jgi:hypothetical protein